MHMLKQAALAAAVTAAFAAAPIYAQTGTANVWSGSIPAPSARADERASAVVRVIDADARGSGAVAVDTAELARARAAGEIQTTEATSAYVLERIRPRAGQAAMVDARDDVRAVSTPTRAEQQATTRFDDVARSREHASYESDRRRRDAEQAKDARDMQARAVEIQRSRASGESRAEIAWSAPDRPIVRVNPPAAAIDAGVAIDASAGTAAGAETQ